MVAKIKQVHNPVLTEVIGTLKQNPQAVVPLLKPIDADLFIPNIGEIDLVGIKQENLVLISTYIQLTEEDLRKAANINQWVFENLSVLKQTYGKQGLAHNFQPQVVLLCSRIQENALPLLSFITDLPFKIFRYQFYKNGAQNSIELIPVEQNQTEIKSATTPFFTNMPKKEDIELTSEELSAFYDAAPELEGEFEEQFSGPYFN